LIFSDLFWPALLGASASVLVGALFAGADTAVTSLSPTHLNALIEQATGKRRAAFKRIQEQEPRIRSRYLVGRIASTATTSFCFFEAFEPVDGRQYVALGLTILITSTFFEIVTSLARKYTDHVAPIAVRWLLPLELCMLPLAGPLGWLGERLSRKKDGEQPVDPRVTEAEVEALVEEGERTGLFGREPAEMIRNVLEFADRTARDVMIPRTKVEALDVSMSLDEALAFVSRIGHSRYPVYREQIDNVVGLLYAKDLFKLLEDGDHKQTTLREIVRQPANFVAESQPLSTLLKEMRGRRQHLAIVVDEFGGISGIVTLEDVLEEIVGDIRDEHDDTDDVTIEDLGDGRLVADATVSMRELCDYLGGSIVADDDAESLGGMLIQHVGKIPEVGTAVSKFGLHFIVRDSDENRIGKVEIIRPRNAAL
jgi:CBS domain containing-hemolysin-like protein